MALINMAKTLRTIALTKNLIHKKWSFMLGSAWYSSMPQKKSLWEVRYRSDGREDTLHEGNPLYESSNKDYFLKLSLFLQRSVDFSFRGFKTWLKNAKSDAEVYKQRYIAKRVEILGSELAAAHFVVYRGGAVKFYSHEKWIRAEKDKSYDLNLPKKFVPGVVVESVDASDANLIYESLIHFESLQRLKWLSFRNNKNIDDWFLDRLSFCKSSLEYLDISGCPNVTERGVIALHRFRHLKVLKLENLPEVKHVQLVKILLEEVLHDCKIEGIEDEIEDILASEQLAAEKLQLDQPSKAGTAFVR